MKELNKSFIPKFNPSKFFSLKANKEEIDGNISLNPRLKINNLNNSNEMRRNRSLPFINHLNNKLYKSNKNPLCLHQKIFSIVNEVKYKPKKNKFSSLERTSREMSFILNLKMFNISKLKNNIFDIKDIKKIILRDHGINNSNEKSIIDSSNKFYHIDENKKVLKNIKKELIKMDNSYSFQNNDFIYNNFEYLCKKCLDNYYLRKIKRNKKKAKIFLDEIYNLDCKEYEKLDLKKKNSLNNHLICYNNLNRKIRIHNLNKNKVDIDNDDLLNKNVKELKNRLKNINYEIYKIGNDITPKFVKKKLKDKTLKQYRGLNGVFFN